MSDDWRSYDDVAVSYERVHAPRFAEPARALVQLAGVNAGGRVLDVGTGTGVVAEAAARAGATVIGVDSSLGMLALARVARPGLRLVAAQAIDLPFGPGVFDVVLAGFVLAHFTRPETALHDLLRVAAPGGTLAVSTWADGRDAFTEAWLELVHGVVPKELLEPSLAKAIPHHDRFRRADKLGEVLRAAGLRRIRVERATYEWNYTQADYIDGLRSWATGRFVRSMIGEDGWHALRQRAAATFADRFPDPMHDRRTVLLASGTKE